MIPTPHFPDSERAIVSCAMIDAADTLTACAEAGVAAASFFLPAERIVFEAISTMVVAGLAVDLPTVAVVLSLIHIRRCRRSTLSISRGSPSHP